MSTLTQEQLDLMADGFEENFTAKPAPAKPGNRARRAPKRPHGWWWDDPQATKELVLSKARPICDDILSRNPETNRGIRLPMFVKIMGSLECEGVYKPDDRTEDHYLRLSDIVSWIDTAIHDAFVRNGRMEQSA